MTQEEQDAIDRINDVFSDAQHDRSNEVPFDVPQGDPVAEPAPPEAEPETTAITVAPSQVRTLAHVLNKETSVLAAEFARMDANRKLFLQWLYSSLVEDVDFGRIHIVSKDKCQKGRNCDNPGHFSKPELFKPGAEKIAGKLALIPEFPDLERYVDSAVDGKEIKSIILRCQLKNVDGQVAGTGIGARTLAQDYNDLNKSLKMCKKSAFVDAVLGCGGISEIFTVDISDMIKEQDKAEILEAQALHLPAPEKGKSKRFVDPPPPANPNPETRPRSANTIPVGPVETFLHEARTTRRSKKSVTENQLRAIWAITLGHGTTLLKLNTSDANVKADIDEFLHWMFKVESNRDVHIENGKVFLDSFMRGQNTELFMELWKTYLES